MPSRLEMQAVFCCLYTAVEISLFCLSVCCFLSLPPAGMLTAASVSYPIQFLLKKHLCKVVTLLQINIVEKKMSKDKYLLNIF